MTELQVSFCICQGAEIEILNCHNYEAELSRLSKSSISLAREKKKDIIFEAYLKNSLRFSEV